MAQVILLFLGLLDFYKNMALCNEAMMTGKGILRALRGWSWRAEWCTCAGCQRPRPSAAALCLILRPPRAIFSKLDCGSVSLTEVGAIGGERAVLTRACTRYLCPPRRAALHCTRAPPTLAPCAPLCVLLAPQTATVCGGGGGAAAVAGEGVVKGRHPQCKRADLPPEMQARRITVLASQEGCAPLSLSRLVLLKPS